MKATIVNVRNSNLRAHLSECKDTAVANARGI